MNEISHDHKEMKVIEGARHVPAYDKEEYVNQSIKHLGTFQKRTIMVYSLSHAYPPLPRGDFLRDSPPWRGAGVGKTVLPTVN